MKRLTAQPFLIESLRSNAFLFSFCCGFPAANCAVVVVVVVVRDPTSTGTEQMKCYWNSSGIMRVVSSRDVVIVRLPWHRLTDVNRYTGNGWLHQIGRANRITTTTTTTNGTITYSSHRIRDTEPGRDSQSIARGPVAVSSSHRWRFLRLLFPAHPFALLHSGTLRFRRSLCGYFRLASKTVPTATNVSGMHFDKWSEMRIVCAENEFRIVVRTECWRRCSAILCDGPSRNDGIQ